MRNISLSRNHARRVVVTYLAAFAAFIIFSPSATAADWNGIEPLKSRRVDVERVLGKPLKAQPGETGILYFNVAGGRVTVAFIDARFVASKKLAPEMVGTVRQIVLQHENASDTPESMALSEKSNFKREASRDVVIFRNLKDGIVYTFIGGRLKTTYFTPSAQKWSRAQK